MGNPVEWAAWIYERYAFSTGSVVFICTIIAMLLGGLVSWAVYERGIDRYRRDHPEVVSSVQPGAVSSPIQQSKIKVFLGHAYLFSYQGATEHDVKNRDKIIDPEIPINLAWKGKDEIPFVFGVANFHETVPLHNARLLIGFREQDNLQIRSAIPNEPNVDHQWKAQIKNRHYWYDFGTINNEWLNSWYPIFIRFPGPGKYILGFEVIASGVQKISTSATVVVRPPGSAVLPEVPDVASGPHAVGPGYSPR
jgi:hypothetical protein